MNGRYDTADNIEAQHEPGSANPVLANKLGILDPGEMDDVELDLLNRLYDDVLGSFEANQRITVADVCEWHRRWLGNVYVWAGKYRTLNMRKGDFPFAASGQIPRLMDGFDKEVLSVHTPCTGVSEDQLAAAIAVVHVELILIHPFREGNGRLSRLLASIMALQAGCRLAPARLHALGQTQVRLLRRHTGRPKRLQADGSSGQASVTRGGEERRYLILASISRTGCPVSIAVELATLRICCRAALAASRRCGLVSESVLRSMSPL